MVPNPNFEKPLAELGQQIRGQRLVRAQCRLVLILALLFAGVFLLDSVVSFSPAALRLGLAVLVGVSLLGMFLGLVFSFRRLNATTLAAIVERKHPELGERLISMVNLAEHEPGHGNPEFIACLHQETEARLVQVDLRRSFSSHQNRSLSMLAGLGILIVLLPVFFWNSYADFARRFFNPFSTSDQPTDGIVTQPVKLASEPIVTITFPSYVNQTAHSPKEMVGPSDISALQYSTVAFQFRFTTSAMAGAVELKSANTVIGSSPLQLSNDGMTGWFSVPALEPGPYRMTLLLEGKEKTISRQELAALEIWPDEPPRFAEVLVKSTPGDSLVDQIWSMPPDDSIPIQVTVEDKVGVDKVALEYRINNGPAQVQIIVAGMGHTSLSKETVFRPAGLKDKDSLTFRFLAADNRNLNGKEYQDANGRPVPDKDLRPHVVFYPADRWFRLQIDGGAKPLPEQDILAQRDRINTNVQAIIKKLKEERADLVKVRDALDGASPHQSAEWEGKMDKLRHKNQAVRQDLHWLALNNEANEFLQSLAALAWDIAEIELQDSAQSLERAKVKTLVSERRDQHLQSADAALAKALGRLEELVHNNDRLGNDRLNQYKLEKLAQAQEQLSAEAEKDLTPVELAQLRAGEERLADDLQGLAKTSKLLQGNMDAAQQEDMQKLEAFAKTPEGQELQKEFAPQLEVLSKMQKDLASKMAGSGPHGKDAAEAAKALEQGQMEKALKLQRAEMKKLEHLSKGDGKSPKTMAQLAKEQKELHLSLKQIASAMTDKMELKMAGRKTDPLMKSNQAKAGEAMKQAQKELDEAVVKLKLGKMKEARPAMQRAARQLSKAAIETKQHMTKSQLAGVPGTAKQNSRKLPPGVGGKSRSGPLRQDLKKYSAEAWGKMPEQLRTRILQDLRAQFGEDYARIIQEYFEKLGAAEARSASEGGPR
jgi:hypothetical protein